MAPCTAPGSPDRPPCWLPGYLAHDCASIFAVAGALAAVLDRARHGSGQTVEVSVQEAALNGLDPWSIPLGDYARRYPLFPSSVPRDGDGVFLVLPTRDGYVRVVPGTPRQLAAFARLLWEGAPDPGAEPHPPHGEDAGARKPDRAASAGLGPSAASGPARRAAAWLEGVPFQALGLANGMVLGASRIVASPGLTMSLVHTLLGVDADARRTRAAFPRSRDEVLATALRLGVPMSPVNTPEEFVAAEQTRARDYFHKTGFPHLGDAPLASAPWRLSGTPRRSAVPLPNPARTMGATSLATTGHRRASYRRDGLTSRSCAGMRVINLGVGAVGPELCWLLARARRRGDQDRVAGEPRLHAAPDAGARQSEHLVPVQRRRPRAEERLPRPAHPRGRARSRSSCARAPTSWWRITVAASCGAWGLDYPDVRRVQPGRHLRGVAGLRARRPARRGAGVRAARRRVRRRHLAVEPSGCALPRGSSLNHPDHIAGKLGAVAVLAALEHRRRTGEGQFIELAQSEAAAYLMGEFYLERALTGRPSRQRGNAVDYACPHGVYPCAGEDRWCAIAVVGDDAWERFRQLLGWPLEARLATLEGRLADSAALDERVAIWTRAREPEDAAALLQTAGVSAMPVQGPEEHRADPHLAARGALVTVVHPEVGPGAPHRDPDSDEPHAPGARRVRAAA